jgi:hypothetical protein
VASTREYVWVRRTDKMSWGLRSVVTIAVESAALVTALEGAV